MKLNEFPLQRKWKSGDCNQIMLLHCRSAHKDELETIEAQKEKSTQKDALQQDVSKMLQKSSVILYNAAKQKELNRVVLCTIQLFTTRCR